MRFEGFGRRIGGIFGTLEDGFGHGEIDLGLLVCLAHDGEGEDEGGALFGIGVVTSDDGAVMQTSQTTAIAEADAGGILLHGTFGGLVIAFEDGFQHIVGDTDAGVAHFGGHQVAFDMHSDGYTAVLGRELQGIG